MKFKLWDKVKVISGGNTGWPGVIREINPYSTTPYYLGSQEPGGWYSEDQLEFVGDGKWVRNRLRILKLKSLLTNPPKFKTIIGYQELVMGWNKVPFGYGRSYSLYTAAEIVYHPIPINFIVRYSRNLWYVILWLVLGPEKIVMMKRDDLQAVTQKAYEDGFKRGKKGKSF